MHIEVHFNLVNEKNGKLLEQLEEVNYYPETSKHENTLSSSYSYSMSIGLQGGYSGGSGSISGSLTSTIGYQYTTATTYEDVEVLANEYYPGKKYDSIDYLFLKANLKAETLPCKGEVLRVSSFVYALEDYSKAFNNQHLLLDIKYEGYIHRASSTTDCEMMKRIEHEYVIDKNRTIVNQNTKEQNISYDVTANNLQRKDLTEYN